MVYKETTCVDQLEWNLDSTEIKCKTCNPEQTQDFSLCLKKWHISNTTTIKEKTLGCFSRNVKKLKPTLMSLIQNITGITRWGKWAIPGLDSVLGSQKDDEFERSSEKRAANSSPFYLCNAQRENKLLFLYYLPRKAVAAFLFRLHCSRLSTVFLLWREISHCLSTFGQFCRNLIIASSGGQHKRKIRSCDFT